MLKIPAGKCDSYMVFQQILYHGHEHILSSKNHALFSEKKHLLHQNIPQDDNAVLIDTLSTLPHRDKLHKNHNVKVNHLILLNRQTSFAIEIQYYVLLNKFAHQILIANQQNIHKT